MDHGCLFNGSSTKKSPLPMAPPYPCQSCAAHDAIVFCPVDGARLCVFCDVDVHGASTLAGLHQRAPLCDSCGTAAAAMRCAATFMVCNDCQWLFKPPGPTRVDVTHYAGCPDPTELMRLLSVEAPAQQDEFDAWLHGLLLLDMDGTTVTTDSSGGGMCDVAIAAAKIDRLLAGYAAAAATGGGNNGSKETDAATAAAPPSGDDDHHQHLLFQPTNSLCTSNNGDKEQAGACCHTRQDPTNQQQKRADRERAKLRYMEKKKKRSFCRNIMYASRKQTADTRIRVKGRFVKASSSSEPHHDHVLNSDPQPAALGSS